jgi:hypothetical protein
MTGPIDVSALQPGFEIPLWERDGTFEHWNRFAGVNADFAGHHMDDEIGRLEGFSAAFIMAPLSHAYLHAMLREWIGDQGRIVNVDMRLKHPLFRGRTMTAGGSVAGVRTEDDEVFVDLDIWQLDDEGAQLGAGTAIVAFPA